MKKNEFIKLAENKGLKIVEVTQGMNGYPSGEYKAIIGFEDFKQAEDLAEEFGLEVVELRIRDGWQFYEKIGRRYNAFDEYEVYLSDDYNHYEYMSFEDFCKREDVLGTLAEANSFDEMEANLEYYKTIYEYIQNLKECESVVVHRESGQVETVNKECCRYHYDVWHHEIAIIDTDY